MLLTPVLKRVGVGKLLGLIFGGLFVWVLSLNATLATSLVWGIIAWSITLGALIGVIGYYNKIPFYDLALPAWLRGGWSGLWMGLVLVLLAYQPLHNAMASIEWLPATFRSAWWLLVDAAIAGAIIDIVATCAAGRLEWRGSGVNSSAHA